MKILLVILAFGTSAPGLLKAEDAETELAAQLDDAEREYECITIATNAMNSYETTVKSWAGGRQYVNFPELIMSFAERHNYTPVSQLFLSSNKLDQDSSDQGGENLNAMSNSQKDVYEVSQAVNEEGSLIIGLTNAAKFSGARLILELRSSEINLRNRNCRGNYLLPIVRAISDVKNWGRLFRSLARQIAIDQGNLNRISDLALDYSSALITRASKRQVIAHAESAKALMFSEFEAESLLTEISGWWDQMTMGGLTQGRHTKYLQFSSSLHHLKSLSIRLTVYEKRLNSIDGIAKGSADYIKHFLLVRSKAVSTMINDIEDSGWQGLLQQQKFMSTKRFEIKEAYVEDCPDLLEEYLKVAEEVKNYAQYLQAEFIYKQQIDTCVAKEFPR